MKAALSAHCDGEKSLEDLIHYAGDTIGRLHEVNGTVTVELPIAELKHMKKMSMTFGSAPEPNRVVDILNSMLGTLGQPLLSRKDASLRIS